MKSIALVVHACKVGVISCNHRWGAGVIWCSGWSDVTGCPGTTGVQSTGMNTIVTPSDIYDIVLNLSNPQWLEKNR